MVLGIADLIKLSRFGAPQYSSIDFSSSLFGPKCRETWIIKIYYEQITTFKMLHTFLDGTKLYHI